MKTQEHTQEPWTIDPEGECGVDIEGADGSVVCFVDFPPDHKEDDGADNPNADRIVACVNSCAGIANPEAIPEVLAALEKCVTDYESRGIVPTLGDDRNPVSQGLALLSARAAIAKAKGGE